MMPAPTMSALEGAVGVAIASILRYVGQAMGLVRECAMFAAVSTGPFERNPHDHWWISKASTHGSSTSRRSAFATVSGKRSGRCLACVDVDVSQLDLRNLFAVTGDGDGKIEARSTYSGACHGNVEQVFEAGRTSEVDAGLHH
jgi:hypothetical protein